MNKLIVLLLFFSQPLFADHIFKDGFEGCSTSIYPQGLRRVSGTYEQYNDGFPFGGSTNSSFELNMSIHSFFSLSNFGYDIENSRRRIVFENAPTNYNLMKLATVSISRCPGDFTESAECVVRVHNTSTIMITTRPTDPLSWCKIEPGVDYYINYILTDDPISTPPSCMNPAHTSCAIFYTEAN